VSNEDTTRYLDMSIWSGVSLTCPQRVVRVGLVEFGYEDVARAGGISEHTTKMLRGNCSHKIWRKWGIATTRPTYTRFGLRPVLCLVCHFHFIRLSPIPGHRANMTASTKPEVDNVSQCR